jgi:hypothetical protein
LESIKIAPVTDSKTSASTTGTFMHRADIEDWGVERAKL